MTGKTHCFTAVAAAITIMQPIKPTTILFGASLAFLGGLTPDVDLFQSQLGQKISKFIIGIFSVVIVLSLIKQHFDFDIFAYFSLEELLNSISQGIVLFLLLCSVGLNTKHRSFTHSILGGILFTFCMYLAFPRYYMYFLIGFASHIILDFFNKKGLQLFFPLEERVCIPLCKATNTYVNRALVTVSILLVILYLVRLILIYGCVINLDKLVTQF